MSNKLLAEDKIFNEMLRAYLEQKPSFLAIIRPKEAKFFNILLPYKRPVMDFGCGDGFFRKVSMTDNRQIIDVGLEIDQKRADTACKSGVYREIKVYDGKEIPYKDTYFSTILSNSVLEHVDDLDEVIKEIYRVLKKNGKFYVSVMSDQYEKNLLGVKLFGGLYNKWMNKKAYHKYLLSQDEWRSKFEDAGFAVKEGIGYLNEGSTMLLDVLQYFSIPAILMQAKYPALSKKYCKLMRYIFESFIKRILAQDSKGKSYSAYFYVLEK